MDKIVWPRGDHLWASTVTNFGLVVPPMDNHVMDLDSPSVFTLSIFTSINKYLNLYKIVLYKVCVYLFNFIYIYTYDVLKLKGMNIR